MSAKLHDAFKKAIEELSVIENLAKYDIVANYKGTEDYKRFVTEVIQSEWKVVEKPRIEAAAAGDSSRGIPSKAHRGSSKRMLPPWHPRQ